MSILQRFTPILANILRQTSGRLFHGLSEAPVCAPNPGGLYSLAVRTVIIENFPRASERKRVTKLGWKARMATRGGQRVIMRRILKKRYAITH